MLHEERERFFRLIAETSRFMRMPEATVEKDYYVMLLLAEIVKRNPDIVFKGGTSLSKCYKVIRRFSEDIDLNLSGDVRPSEGQRRKLKHSIVDSIDQLHLTLVNSNQIRSKREFNRYRIDYVPLFPSTVIKSQVVIETAVFMRTYPYQTCSAGTYIQDYLEHTGDRNSENLKKLSKFDVCVQSLERTLIDKCFALADYYLTGRIEEHSRHIYDIYKLIGCIDKTADLEMLFEKVRNDRQRDENGCPSAKPGIDLNQLLLEIIDKKIYRDDYKNVTEEILFPDENVNYEEAINGLKTVVDWGIFGRR